MHKSACFSCVILSAGSSDRMGNHKALLRFGQGSVTFLEKIIRAYLDAGINQIIVVINEYLGDNISKQRLDLPACIQFVVNANPELGRFNSLRVGMQQVKSGSPVFLQNVDNPFVDKETLIRMIGFLDEAEVIVPEYEGKSGHPVLFSNEVCRLIVHETNHEIRIDQFLKRFNKIYVQTDFQKILVNINSPEDYVREFPDTSAALQAE